MKEWQKGIELDELLKLEKTWEQYNERCLSPFLEMKKNKIAAAIDSGTYVSGHEWAIQSRVLKAKSVIFDHFVRMKYISANLRVSFNSVINYFATF